MLPTPIDNCLTCAPLRRSSPSVPAWMFSRGDALSSRSPEGPTDQRLNEHSHIVSDYSGCYMSDNGFVV